MCNLRSQNSFFLYCPCEITSKLSATIWGTAFVAQSVGMDHVGPFTFLAVRSYLGALVLLPCIWFLNKINPKVEKEQTEEDKKAARKTLIIGGICCGICLMTASAFQQLGIQYTTVGRAGFLTACYIIIVPIISLIFFKKKCSPMIWLAVLLSLVGLYLLCITEGFGIAIGDLLVLICSVLYSLHILVIDYFSPKTDGVKMSCIQFLTCAVLSTIPALIFERPDMSSILMAWGPILYAGVLSSGVAYTLQIVGQKGMNPTIASLILSLESCIAVLAGWVLLNQKLTIKELSGCVLMFAAIILAQLPEKKNAN